jgi:hypothetical protein
MTYGISVQTGDRFQDFKYSLIGRWQAMTDRTITVCAECLTASCWHGEFMCDNAVTAGLAEKTVAELRALRLEHPNNYSVAKISRVCGD